MGLSLLNLGKKIWDQVNPLDNGRTFQNPQGNVSSPTNNGVGDVIRTGPAPSAIQQLTHTVVPGAVRSAFNFSTAPIQAAADAVGGAVNSINLNIANLTNNQKAANNARTAMVNSGRAGVRAIEGHGGGPVNVGADVLHGFVNPIAKPVVGTILGASQDIVNPLLNAEGQAPITTGNSIYNPFIHKLYDYATNGNQAENLSKGTTLAGNAIQTGANVAATLVGSPELGDAATQALARVGGKFLPKVVSRVVQGGVGGVVGGAGAAGGDIAQTGKVSGADIKKGAISGALLSQLHTGGKTPDDTATPVETTPQEGVTPQQTTIPPVEPTSSPVQLAQDTTPKAAVTPTETPAPVAQVPAPAPTPVVPKDVPVYKSPERYGKASVPGNQSAFYNTGDPNLDGIIHDSIISHKGTAATAGSRSDALEQVGISKAQQSQIRNIAVKNVDKATGRVSAEGQQAIRDVITKPNPSVSLKSSDGAPSVKLAQEGAPGTTPTPVAHTGIDPIDKAINNMMTHYNSAMEGNGAGLTDVVEAAKAKARAGAQYANQLWKAVRDNLTEEEDKAVYNRLQGVEDPNLTPKAAAVADAVKPLYDKALAIRQEVDSKVNSVHDYAPRIEKATVGNATKGSGTILGKIKSVLDLGNLNSVFSKSRQVGKFVDEQGNAVFGKPSELGLTRHSDGSITDSTGKVYKQTTTNTHELAENTGRQYQDKSGHVSGIYHADTASLQVRAAALKELNTNPSAHGLFTEDQVRAGNLDGMKEVSVNGLKDENGNNFYAKPKDAKLIERDRMFGRPDTRGIPAKVYDAVSNIATQFIVVNPIFHGANQLVQSMIASGNIRGYGGGWARLMNGVAHVSQDDITDYVSQPKGYIPDYGAKLENVLSKATGGASKWNTKAMAAIELKLRVGLYKASIEGGMSKADAIDNINKFMGDDHQLSKATQRVTIFGHYFKTVGGALVSQVRHPIENLGANVNTVGLAALNMGMTQQYQQFTGNKNAYVRSPGELGLAKELIKVPGELGKGEVPSIVTNRINPVAKEIGQQLANKDLFTGKAVTDSPGGRLGHAGSTLIAPSQQVSQVVGGKRTGAEIAENQLGVYSPHAKGYQATSNPSVSFLNTPGALKGNGEAAQTAYFDGLHQAQKEVHGDTKMEAAFNNYIARSKDPKTGQTIQNSPAESQQNASSLFANDKLRGITQKFEQSQPSHDPMWDLSPDKLKALMQYRAQFTGDAAKTNFHDAAQSGSTNWIDDINAKSNAYYNALPHIPGSKPPEANGPTYPTFDPATTKLLSTYNAADSSGKSTLMTQYSGELSGAFNKIAQYTNAMRSAEGAPQKNDFPVADPETQKIIATYNALPQHDGTKGGNAARYAWAQANPDAYGKMQDYLTKVSLNSLITNASKAQFKGTEPDQQLLKDIKNVGQYDIATTDNGDGTKSYSVNPSLAYSQNAATSGYAYNPTYKSSKEAKYLGNSDKYHVSAPSGKIKTAKVSLKKGTSHIGKFKVASSKPRKNAKVTLKV
jgi:hypothetical protein